MRSQKTYMFLPVCCEVVFVYSVALFPRKVDIKVRWRCSFFVKESFKIQIQFNGIDVCDSETICNHAVGAAATPNVIETLRCGKLYEVVGNQVVRAKSF